MKTFITLFLFCHIIHTSISQVIGNNNTYSETSVAYPNGVASFNTDGGILGASYHRYTDSAYYRRGLFFGGNIQGKNQEGLANLFSTGDFNPEGKVNARIGYTWKPVNIHRQTIIDKSETYIKNIDKKQAKLENEYLNELTYTINSSELDDSNKAELINNVKNVSIMLSKINSMRDATSDLLKKHQLEILGNKIDNLSRTFNNDYDSLQKMKLDAERNVRQNLGINKRHSVFLDFGMSANAFKTYQLRDTLNLSNNFKNQQFEGANIRFGYNFKLGSFLILGGSIGYRKWSNRELLSSKNYSLENSISSDQSKLTSKKEFTAYSGEYHEFNQTYLQFDIVWFFTDKAMESNSNPHKSRNRRMETKNIFGLNPYFNYYASDNTGFYPNISNLGLNVFVFKPDGAFSGGIFVELPDIQNNLEKMKEEPNLRSPFTRLSFGLIGKLSIGSLIASNF